MPIDSTQVAQQVVSTIIYENDFWTNFAYAGLGLIGILIRKIAGVMKGGKKKIADLKQDFIDDSLVYLFSFLCYIAVIALWWMSGFDSFGLYAYSLNASTIFAGLGAEAMLATAMKEKGINVDLNAIDKEEKNG